VIDALVIWILVIGSPDKYNLDFLCLSLEQAMNHILRFLFAFLKRNYYGIEKKFLLTKGIFFPFVKNVKEISNIELLIRLGVSNN